MGQNRAQGCWVNAVPFMVLMLTVTGLELSRAYIHGCRVQGKGVFALRGFI